MVITSTFFCTTTLYSKGCSLKNKGISTKQAKESNNQPKNLPWSLKHEAPIIRAKPVKNSDSENRLILFSDSSSLWAKIAAFIFCKLVFQSRNIRCRNRAQNTFVLSRRYSSIPFAPRNLALASGKSSEWYSLMTFQTNASLVTVCPRRPLIFSRASWRRSW